MVSRGPHFGLASGNGERGEFGLSLTTKLRQLDPGAIEVGSVDRGLVRCAATSAVWLVWQQVFADLRFQASIDKSLSCYC